MHDFEETPAIRETVKSIGPDVGAMSRAQLEAEVLRLRSRLPEAGGETVGREVRPVHRTAGQDAPASDWRHRVVFDNVRDFAIVVIDRDGSVIDWNPGAERIFGWTAEEMRGQPADRIFTPEDRAEGRPEAEMRLATSEARASVERWHLRKDGSRVKTSGEMMPLLDEAGAHRGFTKIVRDRTAEHEAARALREREAHLRHTVELNPQVPWTCDPAGNITSYSNR